MNQLIVPELGEGIEKATVACWHRKKGDEINEGEDVVELVTDKASFCVPALARGLIKEIYAQAGQDVPIGSVLADIES